MKYFSRKQDPRRVWAGITVLLFTSTMVFAQSPDAPAGSIGPRELVARILDLDPGLERLRGQLAVTRAEAEEFRWWDDPELRTGVNRIQAEGGEDLSLELRFYPNNPWEIRREIRKTLAEASLAEFLVMVAEQELSLEVSRDFREIQYTLRAAELSESRAELLKSLLQAYDQAEAAGVVEDRKHRVEADYFEARLEGKALHQEASMKLEELAARAGLDDPGVVDVSMASVPEQVDPSGWNENELVQWALEHDPEFGKAILETHIHEAELAVLQASRIPWVGLLAAGVDLEDRDNRGSEESYSVTAGIQLPIFSGSSRNLGVSERAAIASLARQQELASRRTATRVRQCLRALHQASVALAEYRKESPTREKSLREQLEKTPDTSLELRRTRYDLENALVDIREFDARLEKSYVEALLRLESAIGAPVESFQAPAPSQEPKAIPAGN